MPQARAGRGPAPLLWRECHPLGCPAVWLVLWLPTDGCGLHAICRPPDMDRTDRCDFIGAWQPPPLRRVHRPVRSVTPDQEATLEMIVIGIDSHKRIAVQLRSDDVPVGIHHDADRRIEVPTRRKPIREAKTAGAEQ